jgi:hypothetical protein
LVTADTFKRGFQKGLETLWELTKVVVPVYTVITFLKYTPVIDWISQACAPFMKFIGLPGEASVVLVAGKLINLYAALGGNLFPGVDIQGNYHSCGNAPFIP